MLLITDDYSRYPVVEIVKSTSAVTVIPKLDKVFSEFAVPDVVKSDNGPPLNSKEFDFSITAFNTFRTILITNNIHKTQHDYSTS